MCERRGPKGSGGTEVPQWGPGAKPLYGVWGTKSPKSWLFFVTECLIFDVLEETISKTAKNTIIKIMVGWKGVQVQPLP